MAAVAGGAAAAVGARGAGQPPRVGAAATSRRTGRLAVPQALRGPVRHRAVVPASQRTQGPLPPPVGLGLGLVLPVGLGRLLIGRRRFFGRFSPASMGLRVSVLAAAAAAGRGRGAFPPAAAAAEGTGIASVCGVPPSSSPPSSSPRLPPAPCPSCSASPRARRRARRGCGLLRVRSWPSPPPETGTAAAAAAEGHRAPGPSGRSATIIRIGTWVPGFQVTVGYVAASGPEGSRNPGGGAPDRSRRPSFSRKNTRCAGR